MTRNTLFKLAGGLARPLTQRSSFTVRSSVIHLTKLSMLSTNPRIIPMQPIRLLSYTRSLQKGLSPESENPQPKVPESHAIPVGPADLTIENYNELSDTYLDSVIAKLEQFQEEMDDVDVEYSAGVLTLTFPPNGTYVINKQPPNKQIWLSSPISGPKRYDYVYVSEGQDSKEGTGTGDWIYLRDMSSLSSLLLSELGVDLSEPLPPPSTSGD